MQKPPQIHDVLIIGAGASGLMAAAIAVSRGKRVLLLEKNQQIGKKLAITGGGRCNILNAEADVRTLLSHYGDAAKFLFSPFSIYGMQDTWDFFTTHGLPLMVEAGQRAFPMSERASDVVALFAELLKNPLVTVRTSVVVVEVLTQDGLITGVQTKSGVFTANSYIIATGGLSHPETGSTGDGLLWLTRLGHIVHQPNPSLVPLLVQDAWVHELAGTALLEAKVTFAAAEGSKRGKKALPFFRVGKLLFTHFGLSGPVILNAANDVQALLKVGPVSVTLDCMPKCDVATLAETLLSVFSQHKNKELKNVLKFIVPAGMSSAIAGMLPPAIAETKVHSISRDVRLYLVALIKNLPCTVTGTKSNDWAIVSDGGLDLVDIDTKTMRSKKIPNLYVTGDVLHISRPSGGYSLQLCWTTGAVAGMNV